MISKNDRLEILNQKPQKSEEAVKLEQKDDIIYKDLLKSLSIALK